MWEENSFFKKSYYYINYPIRRLPYCTISRLFRKTQQKSIFKRENRNLFREIHASSYVQQVEEVRGRFWVQRSALNRMMKVEARVEVTLRNFSVNSKCVKKLWIFQVGVREAVDVTPWVRIQRKKMVILIFFSVKSNFREIRIAFLRPFKFREMFSLNLMQVFRQTNVRP